MKGLIEALLMADEVVMTFMRQLITGYDQINKITIVLKELMIYTHE